MLFMLREVLLRMDHRVLPEGEGQTGCVHLQCIFFSCWPNMGALNEVNMTLVAMSFHVALFQTQTILRVTAVTIFQIDTSMSTQLVSRHQYQVPLPPVVLKTDTERSPPKK